MARCGNATPAGDARGGEQPVTAGFLAMVNLQAQIDGRERYVTSGPRPAVSDEAELIELVAMRGHILGRIVDYEWALCRAEQLASNLPANDVAFLARARARGRMHRFNEALEDLDRAQRLGSDPSVVNAERAGIFQATGRYEPALAFYEAAAERRADFCPVAALATLYAERGDILAAERLFRQSRDRYRGVSPFPPAQLELQWGRMWQGQGNLHRALTRFQAAVRLVPAYAPAEGHLAEVEAALGDGGTAIARLFRLTASSDDPEYPAALARTLNEVGRLEEAVGWRDKAAVRYDEVVARHPEAFADHAAEFWLGIGGDPHRALQLATLNIGVRHTARARELVVRASAY